MRLFLYLIDAFFSSGIDFILDSSFFPHENGHFSSKMLSKRTVNYVVLMNKKKIKQFSNSNNT